MLKAGEVEAEVERSVSAEDRSDSHTLPRRLANSVLKRSLELRPDAAVTGQP
jgi:hypothetical protein